MLEPHQRHQGQPRDADALRGRRAGATWSAELDHVFRDEMLENHVEELVQLWDGRNRVHQQHGELHAVRPAPRRAAQGQRSFPATRRTGAACCSPSRTSPSARRRGRGSPGARPMRAASSSTRRCRSGSRISRHQDLLDEVRERGINDFRVFTDVHPEFVRRCMSEIRVLDVNRHTLEMFGAPDTTTLLKRLERSLPRRDGAALQGAADRPVGRQALPAARGRELHARWQRAARPHAVLGAARPRGRLVAGAGRADRHHGAQEGRGLSRVSRQARRADQALQPILLCRRAEPAGAQGPLPRHHHHGRPERPEGRRTTGSAMPRAMRCCAASARC